MKQDKETGMYVITRKMLAERWGVSYYTITKLEKTRKLKVLRIGGIIRYFMDNVIEIETTHEKPYAESLLS